MAYIGNKLADAYTSFAKQDFTTSATTSYTLDNPVANENEIALFINFVRQEPTTAYTATGTTLTLTSATTSSDDMYAVFLGKAVQTVNPPNSSVGNSQLDVSAINSQTAETSIAGGDEVLIYDTSASALRKMTRTNFVSGIGGTNTPAFYAEVNASQSFTDSVYLTMLYGTEHYDTDSAYNTSTGKFTVPSGEAGKYYFCGAVCFDINSTYTSSGNLSIARLIHYNSSDVQQNACQARQNFNYANRPSLGVSAVFDMSVGDYVILQGYITATTSTYSSTETGYFKGFKLVE